MVFLHSCRARQALALLLLSCAVPGLAQQRLTAREAVDLALSQPHVQAELDAGVALARSEVVAARVWGNPTLHVERERDRGGTMPATETAVVLSQPLELGGQRDARIRAAQAGVEAARAGVAHARMGLRGEVLREYHAAAAAWRRKQAQDKVASGLARLAEVAGKRQRAGDLAGYESRRIAQASAQAQARRSEAAVAEQAARTRLAGWVGPRALTAELDGTITVPVPSAGGGESAELALLAAQRDHARAQRLAAGRLALPAAVGVGTKRTREGGFTDSAVVLELELELPVFDRQQAERQRAEAELQRTEAAYERTLQQTRARRAAAAGQARQLADSARHMQDTLVPEAARLTDIARLSFAEGELDLVGLLDAYAAESDLVDAALDQQARALEALLELERLAAPDPTPTLSPVPRP